MVDLSNYIDDRETPSGVDLSSYLDNESNSSFLSSFQPETTYMDEISGAIAQGFRNMRAGTAATGMMAGVVDEETVADLFLESIRNQPETPEYYQRFIRLFEEAGKPVDEAEGFWEKSVAWYNLMGSAFIEAVVNPKATGYVVAESLANSLPAITLGGLGTVGGGAVANAPGAVAGLVGGTSAGTFAVEAGAHLNELVRERLAEDGRSFNDITEEDIVDILQSEEFLEWAESEATKRGLAVAAVEGIFAMAGGKLLAGASDQVASKVVRGAGDVGVETIGEMTGEYLGQTVTEGDVKAGEVALEGVAGLGQSTATAITGATARRSFFGAKDNLSKVVEKTKAKTTSKETDASVESDSLDQIVEETSDATAEGDALDQMINQEVDVREDGIVPEITQREQIQQIIDDSPRLSDKADSLVGEGIFGDDLLAELYIESKELPASARSDSHQNFIDLYESIESGRSIGEQLKATAQDVTPTRRPGPESTFSDQDQLDLLESLDSEFLGDADRALIDPPATTEQSAEELTAPEQRRDLTSFRARFLQEEMRVDEADPRYADAREESIGPGAKVRYVTQADLSEVSESASVFHETNLTNAKSLINRLEAGSRRQSGLMVHENEDLALGQSGKGYVLELDPKKVNGSKASSLANEMAEAADAGAEFNISRTIVGALRSITAPTERGVEALKKVRGLERRFDFDNVQKVERGYKVVRRESPLRNTDLDTAEIDATAQRESATAPDNDIPQPTQAEIEAGNYQKAKVYVYGLPVSIENPRGSVRSGTDSSGNAWQQEMKNHYGYIRNTVGKDKDHIDVFIGPSEETDKVFVVDQRNPETGAFDEHKVVFGANNKRDARLIYSQNYSDDWKGLGTVVEMSIEDFKSWLRDPVLTRRPAAQRNDPVTVDDQVNALPSVQTSEKKTKNAWDVTLDGEVNLKVKRDSNGNLSIDYTSVSALTSPEAVRSWTAFKKGFDKQHGTEQAIQSGEVNQDSSYEVERDLGTTDLFVESELNTAEQVAQLDMQMQPNIRNRRTLSNVRAALRRQRQKLQEKRANHPYFEKGTEDIDVIAKRTVAVSDADKTLRERIRDGINNIMGGMSIRDHIGLMVTDVYGIEKFENLLYGERLSAEMSPTALSHAARNAKVAASMALNVNGLKMDEHGTTFELDESVKSFREIMEPVAALGDKFRLRWEAWVMTDRSERLLKEGRERLLSQEDIDAIRAWVDDRPDIKEVFETAREGWREFNRSILDLGVKAGSINEQDAFGGYVAVETVKGKKNYIYQRDGSMFTTEEAALDATEGGEAEFVEGWYQDDYVPYNRVMDGEVKSPRRNRKIGQQGGLIRKLKGGEGQIPVMDNMVRNTTAILSHAMNTIAMNQTVDMLSDVGVEEISDSGIPPLVDREVLQKALRDQDIDVESMTEPEVRRWERMFQAVNPISEDVVVVYRNGKPKHYRVTEPLLLRSIKHIGVAKVSSLLKILGFPARVLSFSVTKMPGFIIRNLLREMQAAYIINDEGGINPLSVVTAAISNMGKLTKENGAALNSLMARGMVSYNNYYDATPEGVVSHLKKQGYSRSLWRSVTGSLEGAWNAYNRLAVASEHAMRLKLRDDFLASGHTGAEADYQALDVLNHSRRGEGMLIEFFTAVTPFLNPRIQGIDRLYRGGKLNHKGYFLKAAMMASGAMALAAWNWENNEDEMDDLTEIEKDLYFHFWVGDHHIRIPKGFEVGQIAGTFPERVIEAIHTEEPEHAWDTLKRFLITTMAIDLPQFIRPTAEVAMDYDSFSERSILGFGDNFISPEQQADAWTSEIAKWIAETMPDSAPDKLRSPKMVDHLLKGYLGPMGTTIIDSADWLWQVTGNAPDSPKKSPGEWPVLRNVYRGNLNTPSRHVKRFYEMVNEMRTITADLRLAKENNVDEWIQIQMDNADKIQARSALNRYDTRMRRLNRQYREVVESDTFSGSEKAQMMQAITVERNRLAAEASDLYWWAFR